MTPLMTMGPGGGVERRLGGDVGSSQGQRDLAERGDQPSGSVRGRYQVMMAAGRLGLPRTVASLRAR